MLDSPIHLIHRVAQIATDLFEGRKKGNLTARQAAVLAAVAADEGLNQTQPVEKTGVDRSTLADLVRRLVRKGLLQRHRTKADARAYAVKVTVAGRKALQAAGLLAKKVDTQLLSALPSRERTQFVAALRAIIEAEKAA